MRQTVAHDIITFLDSNKRRKQNCKECRFFIFAHQLKKELSISSSIIGCSIFKMITCGIVHHCLLKSNVFDWICSWRYPNRQNPVTEPLDSWSRSILYCQEFHRAIPTSWKYCTNSRKNAYQLRFCTSYIKLPLCTFKNICFDSRYEAATVPRFNSQMLCFDPHTGTDCHSVVTNLHGWKEHGTFHPCCHYLHLLHKWKICKGSSAISVERFSFQPGTCIHDWNGFEGTRKPGLGLAAVF